MRTSPASLFAALAACLLPSFASAQSSVLPGGSLASGNPRPKPIILTHRELIGNGVPRAFTIPEKSDPGQTTLQVRLWSRQWTKVGGQNRSGQVHPGFDYTFPINSHATASLHQRFYDEGGGTALPYSWNAHIVLWEWGPTQPASPEEYIDPVDWPWACEGNDTCYWGAATYDGDKSYRDQERNYSITQGDPWYPAAQTPGATVYYIPTLDWHDSQGVWDGSHAWPVAIRWEQTTLLWLWWE